MARIDSLLSIVLDQNANELRLGVDREPRMLASGVPRRLSLPATPEDTLRELLAGLFDKTQEQALWSGTTPRPASHAPIAMTYETPALGRFAVTATPRDGGGFDVAFLRQDAKVTRVPAIPVREVAAPQGPRPSDVDIPAPADPIRATAGPSPSPGELVEAAFALGASDLHLSEGKEPIVRVHGALRGLGTGPADVASLVALDAAAEARVSGGGSLDLGLSVEGVGRVRAHLFRTSEGRAVTIRLLPGLAPALGSLHMPIALEELVELPHGLVLIGGASGAGKSTTLAALAQEALRRRSIVVTTLEDPIEYAIAAPGTAVLLQRPLLADPLLVVRVTHPETSVCVRKRPDRDPPWRGGSMGRRRKAQGIARGVADADSESCVGVVVLARVQTETRRGSRSEGQVVVVRAIGGGGGRGVANGAPVAHERVTQGAGAQADGLGERDDGPLLAGIVEVVDEGHMLGQEGTRSDVECVFEQDDGGQLGRVDEVGDRRWGRGRR